MTMKRGRNIHLLPTEDQALLDRGNPFLLLDALLDFLDLGCGHDQWGVWIGQGEGGQEESARAAGPETAQRAAGRRVEVGDAG